MLNQDKQIERMKSLIEYGKTNESKMNTGMLTPKVEYSLKAADGKTYGILRECNKFYIKVAPVKDEGVEIMAEDYDYIGGFMNKKENEYSTYSAASKNFDLKMQAINEKCSHTKVALEKETPKAEWQINETREMRAAIDRFKEISNNVCKINEEKETFTTKHTVPEAPAVNPLQKKVQDPFVDTAVAKGDKDFTETNEDPTSVAQPFETEVKDVEKQMKSDKKASKNTNAVYYEKAQYVPDNAIVTQDPKGGKAKMVKEGKTFKLTEAQVLAWNRANPDYMDTTKGTKIGSMAPFTEVVENDDITKDKPNNTKTSEGNTMAPFTEKVNEAVSWAGVAGMDDEDLLIDEFLKSQGIDDDYLSDIDSKNAKALALSDIEGSGELPYEEDEEEVVLFDPNRDLDSEDEESEIEVELEPHGHEYHHHHAYENRRRHGKHVNEDTLNVFGKHPAYQKVPMSTPRTVGRPPRWARDWDDESAKGEEPFGTRKGSTAPFTEIVDILTDAVLKQLNFPKKAQ